MDQIKITSTDQLIQFINTTDLKFDYYLRICRTLTKSSLMWFTGTENKEDITQFLTTYKDRINNSLEVPEFVDKNIINDPEIGKRYFYSNYYLK